MRSAQSFSLDARGQCGACASPTCAHCKPLPQAKLERIQIAVPLDVPVSRNHGAAQRYPGLPFVEKYRLNPVLPDLSVPVVPVPTDNAAEPSIYNPEEFRHPPTFGDVVRNIFMLDWKNVDHWHGCPTNSLYVLGVMSILVSAVIYWDIEHGVFDGHNVNHWTEIAHQTEVTFPALTEMKPFHEPPLPSDLQQSALPETDAAVEQQPSTAPVFYQEQDRELASDPQEMSGDTIVPLESFFALGKAEVTADGRRKLNNIAKILAPQIDDYASIIIEGHTDHTGKQRRNRDLSFARAEAAAAILNKALQKQCAMLGLKPTANFVQTQGWGSDEPLNTGNTKADLAVNRCLKLKCVPRLAPPLPLQMPTP